MTCGSLALMSSKYPFSIHCHDIAVNCVGVGVQGDRALYSDLTFQHYQVPVQVLNIIACKYIVATNNEERRCLDWKLLTYGK